MAGNPRKQSTPTKESLDKPREGDGQGVGHNVKEDFKDEPSSFQRDASFVKALLSSKEASSLDVATLYPFFRDIEKQRTSTSPLSNLVNLFLFCHYLPIHASTEYQMQLTSDAGSKAAGSDGPTSTPTLTPTKTEHGQSTQGPSPQRHRRSSSMVFMQVESAMRDVYSLMRCYYNLWGHLQKFSAWLKRNTPMNLSASATAHAERRGSGSTEPHYDPVIAGIFQSTLKSLHAEFHWCHQKQNGPLQEGGENEVSILVWSELCQLWSEFLLFKPGESTQLVTYSASELYSLHRQFCIRNGFSSSANIRFLITFLALCQQRALIDLQKISAQSQMPSKQLNASSASQQSLHEAKDNAEKFEMLKFLCFAATMSPSEAQLASSLSMEHKNAIGEAKRDHPSSVGDLSQKAGASVRGIFASGHEVILEHVQGDLKGDALMTAVLGDNAFLKAVRASTIAVFYDQQPDLKPYGKIPIFDTDFATLTKNHSPIFIPSKIVGHESIPFFLGQNTSICGLVFIGDVPEFRKMIGPLLKIARLQFAFFSLVELPAGKIENLELLYVNDRFKQFSRGADTETPAPGPIGGMPTAPLGGFELKLRHAGGPLGMLERGDLNECESLRIFCVDQIEFLAKPPNLRRLIVEIENDANGGAKAVPYPRLEVNFKEVDIDNFHANQLVTGEKTKDLVARRSQIPKIDLGNSLLSKLAISENASRTVLVNWQRALSLSSSVSFDNVEFANVTPNVVDMQCTTLSFGRTQPRIDDSRVFRLSKVERVTLDVQHWNDEEIIRATERMIALNKLQEIHVINCTQWKLSLIEHVLSLYCVQPERD